jgi:threonine dehydrogenase-like Zn-dependent dehydrogenase
VLRPRARCLAWETIPPTCGCRSAPSPPARATIASSPPSAPGGHERMRRLMSAIGSDRMDLDAMVTHRFKLGDIEAAYELFANQRDGVLKVAITP